MAHLQRGSIGLGAIALAAAIAVTLAPATAKGSFPGANGVIAYSAEHSIWAVDPATGDQLRLTSGPEDSAPSFSPSGDMLAFQRRTASTVPAFQRRAASTVTVTVYIASADGSNPTPLVPGSEPAFSPNGRQIVFAGSSGLFLTSVASGSPVLRLTDHPGDRAPRWGSKGSIVFQRADGTGSELDVIAPPSSHIRRLLTYHRGVGDTSPIVLWPEWSPNGTTISVALCELGSEQPPLGTVPSIVFHETCAPDVWAPAGGRLVEAGTGPLRGKPDSTCPPFIKGGNNVDVSFAHDGHPLYRDEGPNWPTAWQPLHAGTLRVPTVKCAEDKDRENAPTSATAPEMVVRGGRLCAYFRRRHRRICHRT